MTKQKINESCRVFIQNRVDEIQELMNSGYSLLDLFNYYQDKYELRWGDYPTFGSYVRKSGLTFSDEALKIISKNRYDKKSRTMINKSLEEKAQIYSKFKATLDSTPKDVKDAYIKQRQITKSRYTYEQKQHRIDAMNKTKRQNKSFNTSKPQDNLKLWLISQYGEDNVFCEYKDVRYPYYCDFYIKSEDLFIELNAHFTHGKHPFDSSNEDDAAMLEYLQSKPQIYIDKKSQKEKKSYYNRVINVWTVRDPVKIETAIRNHLKMIVIYASGNVYKYNTDIELGFKPY